MTTKNSHDPMVDPVCKITVATDSKVLPFTFRSEAYYFCADSCRKAFVAAPQRYVDAQPAKRKGWWGRYLDRLNKATGGKPPCCH